MHACIESGVRVSSLVPIPHQVIVLSARVVRDMRATRVPLSTDPRPLPSAPYWFPDDPLTVHGWFPVVSRWSPSGDLHPLSAP